MRRMKEPMEVVITQVKGQKPREPFAVNVKTHTIPKGTHQRVEVSIPTGLTPPIEEVLYVKTKAFITVEGGDARYRLDSTNPTTTNGHLIKNGDTIILESLEEIKGFRVLKTGTENTILQISYKEVVA